MGTSSSIFGILDANLQSSISFMLAELVLLFYHRAVHTLRCLRLNRFLILVSRISTTIAKNSSWISVIWKEINSLIPTVTSNQNKDKKYPWWVRLGKMNTVLSVIYSLPSHIHLRESARKRCLKVWLSAFYPERVFSIRLGERYQQKKCAHIGWSFFAK